MYIVNLYCWDIEKKITKAKKNVSLSPTFPKKLQSRTSDQIKLNIDGKKLYNTWAYLQLLLFYKFQAIPWLFGILRTGLIQKYTFYIVNFQNLILKVIASVDISNRFSSLVPNYNSV